MRFLLAQRLDQRPDLERPIRLRARLVPSRHPRLFLILLLRFRIVAHGQNPSHDGAAHVQMANRIATLLDNVVFHPSQLRLDIDDGRADVRIRGRRESLQVQGMRREDGRRDDRVYECVDEGNRERDARRSDHCRINTTADYKASKSRSALAQDLGSGTFEDQTIPKAVFVHVAVYDTSELVSPCKPEHDALFSFAHDGSRQICEVPWGQEHDCRRREGVLLR